MRDINPYVRKVIDVCLYGDDSRDVYRPLKTLDCRLFYIMSERSRMKIESTEYPLSRGTVVLFASETEYAWYPDPKEGVRSINVNFDYTQNFRGHKSSYHPRHSETVTSDIILEKLRFTDAEALNRPIYLQNMNYLEERFLEMNSTFLIGGKYSEELLSSQLRALIFALLRACDENERGGVGGGLELAESIIQYIKENYTRRLDGETMSREFNFHPAYLNRVVKRCTGVTLHRFITNYRLNAAREMLRSSNMGVSEVARAVGYADVPHFTKSFKKYTGVLPSQIR